MKLEDMLPNENLSENEQAVRSLPEHLKDAVEVHNLDCIVISISRDAALRIADLISLGLKTEDDNNHKESLRSRLI